MNKLKTPIIIINFKTYRNATGKNAEILAKECEKASLETKKNVAIVVQDSDLYRVSKKVSIPIIAEHVDNAGLGGFTGKDTFFALKENGAKGVLINHSEDRIPYDTIQILIDKCKEENITSIVCAKDSIESKELAKFNPDFLAVEPPELIGGDISVSTAKPEVIKNTVDNVNSINTDIKVLCGAGVKNGSDVKKAIILGSKGILLASGITKADNPKEVLIEMLKAL